jgi:hypothetical protein
MEFSPLSVCRFFDGDQGMTSFLIWACFGWQVGPGNLIIQPIYSARENAKEIFWDSGKPPPPPRPGGSFPFITLPLAGRAKFKTNYKLKKLKVRVSTNCGVSNYALYFIFGH